MATELVLAALLGCHGQGKDGPPPGDGAILDLAAEPVATMPTVLRVTWRTDGPSRGAVRFGVAGEDVRTTPEQAESERHEALLVGLPPEVPVELHVESGAQTSEALTVRTGALPIAVPPVTVSGGGNDRFTFTSMLTEDRELVVLLDPQGRVTWAHEDTRGLSLFRVRPSFDGAGLVYLSSIVRGGPSPDSEVVRVGWDGVETSAIAVPDLAHDFVELEDGTVVALAYEQRGDVLGNALLEIPPDGGAPTALWTSWDCFDPLATPGDDPAQGWTHTNALDLDPIDDVFLVGLRNLDGITAVDRATGACLWTLGGPAGDVEVTGARFHHAHQFERIPGGMLVFDNDGAPGQVSRVIAYDFDPDAGTARSTGEIVADPPLFSFILGDVHRLDDGGTMVIWSAAGTLDRYDADGVRGFRAEAPPSVLFGFAWWTADPLAP